MTEQEKYNELMDEYSKAMTEYYQSMKANDEPILKMLREEKGEDWYNDLECFMGECEVTGFLKIVDTPKGDKQEWGMGLIEFSWVDQRSVGDSGDSFEGTITVQIDDKRYLQMPFRM